MNPDELRKLAEEVQCRVVGAVVIKAIGTWDEKPEEWQRSIGYLEEVLLKVQKETRRECADIADQVMKSNEAASNRAFHSGREVVASHRESDRATAETIRNKILSLLESGKENK